MTRTAFSPTSLPHGCPQPLPEPQDSCGIGYIARINGEASHQVLKMALEALANHAHRGAVAADGKTGDGAGVMTQLPYRFLARVLQGVAGIEAPPEGDLAVGMVFMPLTLAGARSRCRRVLEESLRHHGLEPLGWREVPIELKAVGPRALSSRPHIQQIFVSRGECAPGDPFEQALYLARRRAERLIREEGIFDFYVASLSHRTLVYKGLCMADQLGRFYPDLEDPDYVSAVVLFHQRYSTNTFPTWKLAHPFRLICHNGEINTLRGNRIWMQARETALRTEGKDPAAADLTPVIDPDVSDSGAFDNVLEFFTKRGRPLLPSVLMMVPEMWENVPKEDLPVGWRALYQYLSCLMEPWDGPAAISFFDGRVVGTVLDRNGLRPVRYTMLESGLVISASETGCVDLSGEKVVRRGQLGPGELMVVDIERGKVLVNHEIKQELAEAKPYREWYSQRVRALPDEVFYDGSTDRRVSLLAAPAQKGALRRRQQTFGYTNEDEIMVLRPMIMTGNEPVGSMGDDTPPAVLSHVNRPFFHYFRQRFAQVTNPAIDPLRERLVMSLRTLLGRRANILTEAPETTHLLEVPGPILSRGAFEHLNSLDPAVYPHIVLRSVYAVHGGAEALAEALESLCHEAEEAVRQGASVVVIYDGELNPFRAPIPSLLAVSALHQHLSRCGLRLRASLVVASGEPREVHHFACLLGYGADAIYPFLAFETIVDMVAEGGKQMEGLDPAQAQLNFIASVEKGLLKIMAKMGIALLSSYRGAQVFEALGLSRAVVDTYFPGTASLLGGADLGVVAARTAELHRQGYGELMSEELQKLASYGFYKYKKGGELHRFNPQLVRQLHKLLEKAETQLVKGGSDASPFEVLPEGPEGFLDYSAACHDRPAVGIRDLLDFVKHRPPLELDEVEPLEDIVVRFSTGAMSHGSLSAEAHETLAIAMNRLGGSSNSGEGGEDLDRFGTERNSRIKQVASGRFGVTPAYLVSADELQIKMAQGSKPGEGGQIPGHKVSEEIARIRHTTPGVALISPPPHHDIYSIEDLAQLIYDLKRINSEAEVSVKLVSEDGVGTVAAGVAKGFADVIHISGSEGGTGASPLSSIKFAGMPWELGLAQAQQVLVNNRLRAQVKLRVDGGFQTGRDVLVAALLGADQFSFGTSALVAEGCLMARTCHTNTCPVGIASQRADLRAKYPGTPESVIAYMLGVAHEVRVLLGQIGYRSLDEVIGRTELLEQVIFDEEAGHLDLSPLLWRPPDDLPTSHKGLRNDRPQQGRDLDRHLIEKIQERPEGTVSLGSDQPVAIYNTDRTVGAPISGWLARRYGPGGLEPGTIKIRFEGTAGQSFGAFGIEGVDLELWGAANDYVGKGLSGGEIVIRPRADDAHLPTHENAILGNTVLYGATGGRLFAAGRAAQRFCVRNSGATAVVEGVGEHACEYMTGGRVVVLGRIGRNFGAGMSGGTAYLYDEDGSVRRKLNPELIEAVAVEAPDELKALVEEHYAKTGSGRARELVADWTAALAKFLLVRPRATVASIEAHNEGVEEQKVVA